MGTFYRSRHELVFGFKHGSAPHINSFELGQHGRYRTNVWEYKGVNTLRAGRMEELELHPTVKPVQMIADAIKDVSTRGAIVLDPFAGSGSTLIAAHRTGRRAYVVELDPIYCDRIIARWEAFAKDEAGQLLCGMPKVACKWLSYLNRPMRLGIENLRRVAGFRRDNPETSRRPRGRSNKSALTFGEERLKSLLLNEAYRTIILYSQINITN